MNRPPPAIAAESFPGFAKGLFLAFLYTLIIGIAIGISTRMDPSRGWRSWIVEVAAPPAAIAIVLAIVRRWLPIPWTEATFLSGRPCARGIMLTIALGVLTLTPSIGILSVISHTWTISAETSQTMETAWKTEGTMAFVLSLITAVVVGPICEELLFRGVLLGTLLRRHGMVAAIVLSSALFTLGHLSIQWVDTLVMAVVLGWWVARTRVLAYGCLFHMLWNGLACLLPEKYRFDPAVLPLRPALLLAAGGSLALAFYLWYLVRSPATPRAASA